MKPARAGVNFGWTRSSMGMSVPICRRWYGGIAIPREEDRGSWLPSFAYSLHLFAFQLHRSRPWIEWSSRYPTRIPNALWEESRSSCALQRTSHLFAPEFLKNKKSSRNRSSPIIGVILPLNMRNASINISYRNSIAGAENDWVGGLSRRSRTRAPGLQRRISGDWQLRVYRERELASPPPTPRWRVQSILGMLSRSRGTYGCRLLRLRRLHVYWLIVPADVTVP